MDNNKHPITPPPELVERLQDIGNLDAIALAYRAGWKERGAANEAELQRARDGELEAMLAELKELHLPSGYADRLRAARSPKTPSLKELALNDLDDIPTHDEQGRQVVDLSNIRLALEALPND